MAATHWDMDLTAVVLITIGGILLAGMFADFLGRHTPLPRVTLLLLVGVLVGPEALDLLPPQTRAWFGLTGCLALTMVGFLLGGRLVTDFGEAGRTRLAWITIMKVSGTWLLVSVALWPFTGLRLALVLGAIAPATAPAATVDVISSERGLGRFGKTVLGVVALDDILGLFLFSLVLSAVESLGTGLPTMAGLFHGLFEIGGSVLLGVGLGVPMAFLSGRIRPGEPTLVEALGIVTLCGGIAILLGLSFILTALVLGATVALRAEHHERPFHAIQQIEWPFLVLFFFLAGASLEPRALWQAGLVGVVYVLSRAVGTWLSSSGGAAMIDGAGRESFWLGLALLPQAGVALGMALVASDRLPDLKGSVLPVVLGGTVFFEIVGPWLARLAARRVRQKPNPAASSDLVG